MVKKINARNKWLSLKKSGKHFSEGKKKKLNKQGRLFRKVERPENGKNHSVL